MNDTWLECLVGDIAAPIRNALVGGPFGSNLVSKDYVDFGIPVIRGQNMGLERWVDGEFVYVSPEKADSLSANIARPNDLIFTQRGTLGQVAIVPEDSYKEYIISQSQMKLTPDPSKGDVMFLYYCFTSPEQQQHIRNNSIQTGVPHTNLTILRNTPLFLPPLEEQRAIAHILGSLDDKIEANRRMNESLEAIARTLFKSWFVDFDPVHSLAHGEQPPGLDADTAALFPDNFEDSALGVIPRGWAVLPLREAIEVNPSRRIKEREMAPYLSMANMPTDSMRPENWEYRDFGSGMCFMNGDVLFARITPCLENGKTAYVDFLEDEQVGWGSTEYIVFRSPEGFPPEYAYFLARDKELRSFAIANMTGTSGRQRVSATAFDYFNIVLPPRSIAERFGDIVYSMSQQMKVNSEQSRTLAETRDALLPKLVSGEIRVGDL